MKKIICAIICLFIIGIPAAIGIAVYKNRQENADHNAKYRAADSKP